MNKNIDTINYNIENIKCHINENKNQIENLHKNLEEIGNKVSFIQSENESKFCHLYEILQSKLDINEFKEVTKFS
jgi:archaellum component FlaC